jgi:hypothetical protein
MTMHDLSAAPWRKSSYSGDNGGDCIEAALGFIPDIVPVRDSKDPEGPALVFPAAAFAAFVRAVEAGEFAEGEQYVTP